MRKVKVMTMTITVDFSLTVILWMALASLGKSATDGVVSVPPSEYWDGNDGPWSTFAIEVGTPPQNLRVLASTSSSSTWVVLPDGCIPSDPTNCPSLRGFTFKSNNSRGWSNQGLFQLPLQTQSFLGYSGNANFGLDNLTLGWQGQDGPTLNHQVIAGIATKDFYLGELGINARPVNFTDFNHPNASLLGTLRAEGRVKGTSFGYTAGAPYRPTKVFGSLTFGGYDASRFTPNNITFSFGADISRDLLVGIHDISTTTNKPTPLLPSPIAALIDSTVPDIWLPVSACQQFEQTLGLVWDAATELYLVNDSLHDALVARNEVFRFRLGMEVEGGETTDLVIPYKAFDLEVTPPETQNKTRYFPIRRAANDSMYTIGRTFLQESYLFVDYDRGTFTLSQALFPSTNVQKKLIAVQPPTAGKSSRLSRGAIAGIAVGIILVIVALLATFFFILRRRRHNKKLNGPSEGEVPDGADKAELDTGVVIQENHEVVGDDAGTELAAGGKDGLRRLQELEGQNGLFEMPGTEVKAQELDSRRVPVRSSSTSKSTKGDIPI